MPRPETTPLQPAHAESPRARRFEAAGSLRDTRTVTSRGSLTGLSALRCGIKVAKSSRWYRDSASTMLTIAVDAMGGILPQIRSGWGGTGPPAVSA
jgi:hypothetical protein